MIASRRSVLAVLAGLPLAAAMRPAIAGPDLALLNEEVALGHAAPRYAAFAEAAGALQDSLADLDDGTMDVSAARAAFHTAMDGWMGVQHLRLGPSQMEAREFRIAYWPDKRNRVDRQLGEAIAAERDDLLTPGGLAGASVAIQGFPALERLLFVEPVSPGTYAADLTAAIGANLAAIAEELSAAWTPGSPFMTGLLVPGSSPTAYADPAQVTGHLMTSFATQLEFIALRKIAGPLDAAVEEARPRLAESWRSVRSLRNIRINVDALEDVWSGGGGRFDAALDAAGQPRAGAAIREALAAASGTLAPLPDALASLVEDGQARLVLAAVAGDLDAARRRLVTEAAPALGLSLGFNSLDGD